MTMLYETNKPNDTGGVLAKRWEREIGTESEGCGSLAPEGEGCSEDEEGEYEGAGVYCFTHTPSGKKYIGSSSMCARRRQSHVASIKKGDGQKFHLEAGKLGLESFTFEIIEKCSDDTRYERERFWIEKLGTSKPNGFNMNKPRLVNNDDPQIVIHLEHDLHRLLKKAAVIEGRTLKRQAEYILRSRLTPLLTAAQEGLPAQKVLPWRKKP